MTTPEMKQDTGLEPAQSQVPEVETPKEIPVVEEKGTTVTPGDIATQVAANAAAPAPQTPTTQVITVTVPATPQQLEDWSKGDPVNSLTWLSFYWLRMIKKALLHGYRVVSEPKIQTQYA